MQSSTFSWTQESHNSNWKNDVYKQNKLIIKKKERKRKALKLWNNDSPKTVLSLFSVKYLVLNMQPTLQDSNNALEKNKFSPTSISQLEMVSGLCMIIYDSRSPYRTVLCRPFTCYLSVCEFICMDTIEVESLVFLGMVEIRLVPIYF